MFGHMQYTASLRAMQAYTHARNENTPDVLWMCEHDAVFTQGMAGKPEHVLQAGAIPVIKTNRGGQVTFHGPGQVVAYPMIDLQRIGYYVKEYVFRVEEAVIRTLADYGITGHRVAGAPGIYVRLSDPASHALLPQRPRRCMPGSAPPTPDFTDVGKIAALGIKVSRHRTYHGVAFNVAMDLSPFQYIHPCGYAELKTIDLASVGIRTTWEEAAMRLGRHLQRRLDN